MSIQTTIGNTLHSIDVWIWMFANRDEKILLILPENYGSLSERRTFLIFFVTLSICFHLMYLVLPQKWQVNKKSIDREKQRENGGTSVRCNHQMFSNFTWKVCNHCAYYDDKWRKKCHQICAHCTHCTTNANTSILYSSFFLLQWNWIMKFKLVPFHADSPTQRNQMHSTKFSSSLRWNSIKSFSYFVYFPFDGKRKGIRAHWNVLAERWT